MLKIRTILVPTDFSENANQALGLARSLARDHGATLVVVHIPLPPPSDLHNYLSLSSLTMIEDECKDRLRTVTASIDDVKVETRVSIGDAGPNIVSIASDCDASLIVMGTHGLTGLTRILLGSVAEFVMRNAPCPVMTIKQGTAERMQRDAVVEPSIERSPPPQ
ncbi:universal stress protein [Schlesneria paludicola]|uniref:universal stress protein n=1 Tax=Schlesneria paludicola TaxID=360056 RepID=UPI000299E937|nr:universal stress protein [Schlesneria paludicola]